MQPDLGFCPIAVESAVGGNCQLQEREREVDTDIGSLARLGLSGSGAKCTVL